MALTLQISDSTQTPYSSGASGLVPLRGTASSYAGSPVGEVAGMAGNLVMDNTTGNLWLCTTEGSSGTAVWERMAAYNPVVIAPTASETLPVGTRVIVMPPALTADITLTTGSPPVGGEAIIYGSAAAYTTTVASPVTSGSPYIEMPDGSQVYSYVIPASSPGAGIRIVWDGTNYRATTFGTTIVAPATASNEAVQLGQWTYGGTAAAGWRKDPAGNIEQWGQFAPISVAAATGVTEAVTFPIAFTDAASIHVQVGLSSPGAAGSINAQWDTSVAITTTGFTAAMANTGTSTQDLGFTWTARGR